MNWIQKALPPERSAGQRLARRTQTGPHGGFVSFSSLRTRPSVTDTLATSSDILTGTCSQESGRTVQGNPAEAALWR
ncbi:hypothetical protein PFLUV_G00200550 [Perca fluviatilis]|uniref:Uncharacterized protein n=1 Tax=Perca fluviatilis TaxID=8168 RepID=A0A6A5ETG1_PERFL|nr:hypothetical protein PFLUV_G00200550 [Perca fluviatilis]